MKESQNKGKTKHIRKIENCMLKLPNEIVKS